MKQRVIKVHCNRASDPRCSGCGEDVPHDPGRRILYSRQVELCTTWGECWPNGIADDRANFKARCVRVKGEQP